MSRRGRQTSFAGALALLTLLPVPKREFPASPGRISGWFPLVGALVFGGFAGLLLAAGQALSGLLGHQAVVGGRLSLVFAALAVAGWGILSRLIHWDGLADTGDAFWGGATTDARLEIMRDSATGAFGVAAIVFVAILQVSAVSSLAEAGTAYLLPALVLAPTLGRLSATFGTWFGRPARSDGLGMLHDSRPGPAMILSVVATVSVVAIAPLWMPGVQASSWGLLCLAGVGLSAGVPHLISMRFGGVTGDVLGASVLLTETLVLLSAAMIAGV